MWQAKPHATHRLWPLLSSWVLRRSVDERSGGDGEYWRERPVVVACQAGVYLLAAEAVADGAARRLARRDDEHFGPGERVTCDV